MPTRREDPLRLDPACPTHRLMELIGDRWSVQVIIALHDGGEIRSADLLRSLAPISRKVLTWTLRSLEDAGLVARTVEATVPVSVSYRLTDTGLGLYGALVPLRRWAETHFDEPGPR